MYSTHIRTYVRTKASLPSSFCEVCVCHTTPRRTEASRRVVLAIAQTARLRALSDELLDCSFSSSSDNVAVGAAPRRNKSFALGTASSRTAMASMVGNTYRHGLTYRRRVWRPITYRDDLTYIRTFLQLSVCQRSASTYTTCTANAPPPSRCWSVSDSDECSDLTDQHCEYSLSKTDTTTLVKSIKAKYYLCRKSLPTSSCALSILSSCLKTSVWD